MIPAPPFRFRDREDAAFRLAERLQDRPFVDPLVLAIPRGGVPVGAVLARVLGAELDVVLARKLRAPFQSEFAIGAVGEDGHVTLQPNVWTVPGVTDDYIATERQFQMREIERRKRHVRTVRPPARITGRSVIVTDDGIATGSTMLAALQAVREQGPRDVLVAVPVASPDRLASIQNGCDTLCLLTPEDFTAVGQYYEDFHPVEDETVLQQLRDAAPARHPPQE